MREIRKYILFLKVGIALAEYTVPPGLFGMFSRGCLIVILRTKHMWASMLDGLVDAIRNYPGVTRKNPIREIVGCLPLDGFPQVAASEGEDAAAVEYGDGYLLVAADGIMGSLMEADPFYAGYFAVLVNVSDIAAMGGTPVAMVDVISIKNRKVCSQILEGLEAGVKKFNVPIVGGHTNPDSKFNSLEISIMGSVSKEGLIRSTTAQDGDDIVFVMDLDGFFPEKLPYAWDTTTRKDGKTVRGQIALLHEVGIRKLVSSGKDMSNPGCIGTLGMMLESSSAGGTVDITKIPRPEGIDFVQWCLAYQGFGFVFACPPENTEELIKLFSEKGVAGAAVGKVDSTSVMKLTDGKETRVLYDFSEDIITGCRPKKKR